MNGIALTIYMKLVSCNRLNNFPWHQNILLHPLVKEPASYPSMTRILSGTALHMITQPQYLWTYTGLSAIQEHDKWRLSSLSNRKYQMSLKIEQRPQMNTISIKLSFFSKRHIFTCMYRVWNCLPLNKRVPAWYPGATYIKTYMKYNDVPTKCDRDDTRVKTHNLFRVDENSLEQCCAAHIVQCCQQYCSALLHLIAG